MVTPALTKLFKEFFESERAGGLILVGCTLASIFLTNSGAGDGWLHFWHARLDLSFGGIPLDYSVEHWVNDGLMAVFFLLVGLEIERELYAGELADFKKALLPIVAAIGGMLVPAGVHFLFNRGTPWQHGFGIPMATDIAFALGVLSLLGNKVPVSAKIFLTALAIIDDLGAILVIAFFYTKSLSLLWLAIALGIFLLLLLFNKLNINKLIFYIIPGIIMWYCMLRSGIHATLSGVLLAFAIPFRKASVVNPSETIQHILHKPVAFFILPAFALANTGILLSPGWAASLGSSGSLGILFGLVLGKPVGILLCCWLAIRSGICRLPEDIRWSHLTGLGVLAGIGFTMSIFIANLAFDQPDAIQFSKIAILAASLLASLMGFGLLKSININK
ncbi:MAG: Na+/H+ antiporter NhaA [Chitinophagaceae bacterium]|nr:Na+/H+ antiporter NhaA [Chitinophagaceae bacterium]